MNIWLYEHISEDIDNSVIRYESFIFELGKGVFFGYDEIDGEVYKFLHKNLNKKTDNFTKIGEF